jgi:predicted glycosyl hydrolase (DUF1957 family)
MISKDEWGHDPSVQVMRRIFKHMEMKQEALLKASNITPFDARLRQWREKALEYFEKSWAYANNSGMNLGEEKIATLYVHCLIRAITGTSTGAYVEMLSKDETIEMLLTKALS